MASFNRVILMGNLVGDPQVRYTPGGQAVSEVRIAVNHSWLDKQTNQRKEEATFVDVTLWGRTAEIAGEYLAKGRQVLIEGRLKLDQWDDKQTGQKRSKLSVVCENMTMLGSRQDGGGRQDGGSRGPGNSAVPASESVANYDSQEPQQSGGYEQSAPSGGEGGGDVPF